MTIIQTVIDFIMKLGGNANTVAPKEEEDPEPTEEAPAVSDEQQDWNTMLRLIAHVESGAVSLAGVDPEDPKTWWTKQSAYERACHAGESREEAARSVGFRDVSHLETIQGYMNAKWSVFEKNEDGRFEIRIRDEFVDAIGQVGSDHHAGQQQAAIAADPRLLEPVGGVTLEQWATASGVCARLGAGATPQQVAEALARFGLTPATFDAACSAWQAKMTTDTTFVIATKFGEYYAPQSAGDAEPCTFETYVEVFTAQSCWADQGKDVAKHLQDTFGIDAATFGVWGLYWSPKMQTQAMYRKLMALEPGFQAKYARG
jgi:hypothetical protein